MGLSTDSKSVTMEINVTPETARVLQDLSAEYYCSVGTLVDHMVAMCYPDYDPRRERLLTELSGVLDADAYL